MGRGLLLKAVIDAGFLWLAIIFAIIGICYCRRLVKVMYFDNAADFASISLSADLPMRWVISRNGLGLVELGIA